jgi:hypothetical protein
VPFHFPPAPGTVKRVFLRANGEVRQRETKLDR